MQHYIRFRECVSDLPQQPFFLGIFGIGFLGVLLSLRMSCLLDNLTAGRVKMTYQNAAMHGESGP